MAILGRLAEANLDIYATLMSAMLAYVLGQINDRAMAVAFEQFQKRTLADLKPRREARVSPDQPPSKR